MPQLLLPPSCGSQEFFGTDCPGCGLTRSFVHLAQGDLRASFQSHRLGWMIMSFAFLQIPYRMYLISKPRRQPLGEAVSRWIGRIVIGLLLANWLLSLFGIWIVPRS